MAALGLICAGCALPTNPTWAARTISGWVPVGTAQDDADRIMRQHGHGGRDFHYVRVGKIHNWLVQIHEQDGKVATNHFPVKVFFTGIDFRT